MNEQFKLHLGKSQEVLKEYPDNYFDSVVCDPPYHLTSIVKRFGKADSVPAQFGTDGAYARAARGFMGKEWDGGDIAFCPEFWVEVLRVLKPGGHLLAFSGSRTYHRMACGIEDAGFDIRDCIMWLYGSGFPKSHAVDKALDGALGKQAHGFNCKGGDLPSNGGSKFRSDHPEYTPYQPQTDAAKQWQGWGSALKPAHEPICVARKPLVGTIAENVMKYGTGALNIDGCRVETDELAGKVYNNSGQNLSWGGTYGAGTVTGNLIGRWPANVIHDGSAEVVARFPTDLGDTAARFFYCAKASKEDRDEGLDGFDEKRTGGMQATADGSMLTGSGNERQTTRANTHPTVKPTDLMRYLCRLVTPPGGLVLDPFMGSGSTGKAAMLEGFRFVGIDMTPEYLDIARARIQHAYDRRHDVVALVNREAAHSDQMSLFDNK